MTTEMDRVDPFLYRPLDPSLTEWLEEVRRFKTRSPRTLSEYAREVEQFGRHLHGIPQKKRGGKDDRDVVDPLVYPKLVAATSAELVGYFRALTAKPFRRNSLRRKAFALRSYYQTLVKLGMRPDDPTAALPVPEKDRKRDPKVIPEDQIGKLLRATLPGRNDFCRTRDTAMLELLYASGVRRAELISIRTDAIDWRDRAIRVIGKGAKPRTVYFNEAAEKTMRAWLAIRPRSLDNILFLTENGTPLSHSYVGKIFRAYVDVSGLDVHATPHAMRHSFAVHLLQNGADLVTIKDLLGHESFDTTKIYLSLTDSHRKSVYDKSHPRDKADY
jgi:integrase/recombinase XerC